MPWPLHQPEPFRSSHLRIETAPEVEMECVLGFDTRFDPQQWLDQLWSSARRRQFLLREETTLPLSIDDAVWPSVFLYPDENYSVHPLGLPLDDFIRVEPLDYLHSALQYWQDIDEMIKFLQEMGSQHAQQSVPIAVTLNSVTALADDPYWGIVLYPMEARSAVQIPKGWHLLGYDVSDGGVSALSNCAYTEDEKPALQREWASQLNEFGLFGTAEKAHRFREMSDRRVADHSPFYVFGLYRLAGPS